MNVVFYAPNFYPMVGGVENIVMGISNELTRMGHAVRVLTLTHAQEADDFSFAVIRNANSIRTVKHLRWADIVVHVNISLKGILPMLLVRRPLVVYHNGVYPANTIPGWLKQLVVRKMAINVGCSPFISRLFACTYTIPNPYKDVMFRRLSSVARTKDLVFLGRLVSEKGCDVLLNALYILKQTYGNQPNLTIIGDGPEKPLLTTLATKLGIEDQLQFVGAQQGETLVRSLNEHRILMVPSNYNEPFGAVGVEGIACGCFVISSDGGGLPDTVGPGGITFPKGNPNALAEALQAVLQDPSQFIVHQENKDEHLRKHSLPTVTKQFVAVFNKAIHD